MRLGVDLGGTKIEAVALDGSRELARLRVPTPRDDYAATVGAIRDVVSRIEELVGARGTVGIGIPGAISPATGLVKNANSVWLIGHPLKADVEAALGREVRIENDANCFAMSEAIDGAAAGARVVFGVIVGTGTGAGIVSDRQLLRGAHGIAGEWGHNPLPWPEPDEWPGPACYCGRTGCIETFLSGPGLVRDVGVAEVRLKADTTRTRLNPDTTSARLKPGPTGTQLTPGAATRAEDVVAAAASGDAAAEAAVVRYERRMARALASIINVLDPDVIVLGGGMSNVARLYDNVPRHWSEYVFACGPGERVTTRLVAAKYGDASGVRGAAWLWNNA
jgi:fructokinase